MLYFGNLIYIHKIWNLDFECYGYKIYNIQRGEDAFDSKYKLIMLEFLDVKSKEKIKKKKWKKEGGKARRKKRDS